MHPAHLQESHVAKLQQWEHELSRISGEKIILVAYSDNDAEASAANSGDHRTDNA
ncbi:hypothetical protein [Paenibacillus apiarius]|uniref:Uncharacterized protein n=1 Tax=Paenibacillus apiarius TaxID=46240 RepID=A0ABT4DSB1_9BACL|nr:hypothetical protein [Paenibacillus apiarius]MBN3527634.1 hypothetical protein [Paenibacillus apiarius]MCY9517122.1 hypothetical protein [Paenibacillus apiarius]MCY9520181.1 hypothetical protein [Paenibacillus apiarius]MCY9554931.1 hypothetical protein [Paenibacillus apiarius]MCY9561442.1 hypothetical protein [Paenibacillus apiarius]